MPSKTSSWPRRVAVAAFFLAAACDVGSGSDIGPRLPRLSGASCKVVVLDDAGRGVVGAAVTAGNAGALTGRNGRGDLLANPRGRVVFAVDAGNGAAAAGDELATYRVALDVTRQDVSEVLHVPDLPASASAVLTVGTQVGATTIPSPAGGLLRIAAGASVGLPTGAATATVRVGDLQMQHLPGALPVPASGTWLFGAGVFVDAAGAEFSPAADLDVVDDLGLGTGVAQVFKLDPVTGEWGAVPVTAVAGSGRLVAAGAVAGGGLYVCAAPVAAATVAGRIVDVAGASLRDTLVRVDQHKVLSDTAGQFVIGGVPATLADGSPRQAVIEVFAGGLWLPVRATFAAALPSANVDVGDLALDTLFAGNIRVQQVQRGRAEVVRPVRLSSLFGDVALATTSDDRGQAVLEDVPAQWFGFLDGRVLDVRDVWFAQSLGILDRGQRWLDIDQFFLRRTWYQGGRRSRTLVTDAFGGGPILEASVVQGVTPADGRVGETREAGSILVSRDFRERATASKRFERDGRVVISAYSIVNPNGDHLEMPLQRPLRTPLGAFDRHGLVAGSLTGANSANQHELRVTRRLSLQEWWEEIAEGARASTAVPLDVDPATTHAAFVVGVPTAGGNLAATECVSPGGVKTLQKVGIVADLVPVEGGRIPQDIALAADATEAFTVPGALANAPLELDLSQLSLSLALQQPTERVVDVVRGLRGNHAAAGSDLVFTLPPLTGALAGNGWYALLDGSYGSDGTIVRCSAVLSLPRASALPSLPRGAFAFGGFPSISAPANGGTVSAGGFTVEFALPANALHGLLELRSDTVSETLVWQVLVPPTETGFAFVTLPVDVATPLLAGRTYSLTVSAFFGDGIVTEQANPYESLSTFVQSIGTTERGCAQVTRRTITVTAN